MYGLILRRITAAILTISVLTVFVFALLYLFPGDPAERILQTRMNGELPSSRDTVEVLKKESDAAGMSMESSPLRPATGSRCRPMANMRIKTKAVTYPGTEMPKIAR